jgi:hypothetical protein
MQDYSALTDYRSNGVCYFTDTGTQEEQEHAQKQLNPILSWIVLILGGACALGLCIAFLVGWFCVPQEQYTHIEQHCDGGPSFGRPIHVLLEGSILGR